MPNDTQPQPPHPQPPNELAPGALDQVSGGNAAVEFGERVAAYILGHMFM